MSHYLLNIFNKFKKHDTRFYYLSLIYENDSWCIHGLWPQYDINSYPVFCKNVSFNPKLLDPIYSDLNKYWHSDRGSNDNFWEHEWKKHGSCMFINMNEFNYFNKTLELFKQVKELNIIEKYRNNNKALIPFDLNFKLKSKINRF